MPKSPNIPLSQQKSLIKIGEAAKTLGVSIDTIRRWEKVGKITTIRTLGGTRLFEIAKLQKLVHNNPETKINHLTSTNLKSYNPLNNTPIINTDTIIEAAFKSGKFSKRPAAMLKTAVSKTDSGSSVVNSEQLFQNINRLFEQTKLPQPKQVFLSAKLIIASSALSLLLITTLSTSYAIKNNQLANSQSSEILGANTSALSFLDTILAPFKKFTGKEPLSLVQNTTQEVDSLKQSVTKNIISNMEKQTQDILDSIAILKNSITVLQEESSSKSTLLNNKLALTSTTTFNLLSNSSFEANSAGQPTNWSYLNSSTASNTFVSGASVRSGNLAVQIVSSPSANSGSSNFGIYQPSITTAPNHVYTLSAYVRSNSGTSGTIRLSFWGNKNGINQRVVYKDFPVEHINDWRRYSFTLDPPNQAAVGSYFPMIEILNLGFGIIYLDDIDLSEGFTNSTYDQENLSMGDGSITVNQYANLFPSISRTGSLGLPGNTFNSLYLTEASIDTDGNANFDGIINATGNIGTSKDLSATGNLYVNGGSIFSSSSSFSFLPNNVTTLNLGGAATATNIGASTGTTTVNNNLVVTGTISGSSNFSLPDGSAATPALNFTNNTNAGLYRLGSNSIGLITNGSATSGITINSGSVGIGTTTPGDTLDITGTLNATGATTLGSTLDVTGVATLTSTLTANGAVNLGDTTGDDIAINGRITTSIVPKTTANVDLGSASLKWNNIYAQTINTTGTNTSGQAAFTYDPADTSFAESSVFINPTTAASNETLFGIGIAGSEKAGIDAEGDLVIGYSSATAPLVANPLNVYNHGTTAVFTVTETGITTITGNVNANGGLDIDDIFVVADTTGILTTGGLANLDGGIAVDTANFTVSGTTGAVSSASTITGTTLNGTTGINTGAGAGTNRIDSSGNLVNIGTITTSGAINKVTITSPATSATLTIADGKTLTVSGTTTLADNSITFGGGEVLTLTATNALTLTTTGTTNVTLPTTGTLATLAGIESLSNKTLVSPVITTSPTAAGSTWADLGTVTTIDINGGTIDGITIGGASAGAGTFTDLTVTGNTVLGNSTTVDTLTASLLTSAITSGATTENAFAITASSLTSGTALALASTATSFDGELLTLSKTGASSSTAYTSDIANITYSQTFNGGVGLNSTGNVFDISRAITLDNVGNTHTISGALVTIADTMTQTAGTLTHTASLLDLTQNYTSSTGTALYIKSYGADAGLAFRLDDESGDTTPFVIENTGEVGIGTATPGNFVDIVQTSTTGDALKVYRNLAAASTDSALGSFVQDNSGDDQQALYLQQDGTGIGLQINNNSTGSGIYLTQGTTGTGIGLHAYSNVDATANSPLIMIEADNTAFDKEALYIENNGTGASLSITQTTTGTSQAAYLYSNVDATANQPLLHLVADNTAFDKELLYLQNDGAGVGISVNQGTTGTEQALYLYSNVSSTANQPLAHLIADDTTFDKEVLYIQNDGTSTGIAVANNGNGSALTLTSSATTGTISTISSTTLTTGNAFDVTATYVDATGGTDSGIDINLTNTPTVTANTLRGVDVALTDATALANTLYGTYSTVDNSANTAVGTHSIYGGYFTATGKTAGTTTAVGLYASASGADNNYGLQVAAGQSVFSSNGAASAPAILADGTWYTGGSATTTKPQFLIEPAGTTSTAWSTSGTGLGINAATAFAGNLIDIQQNAVSLFKLVSANTAVNGFSFTTTAASGTPSIATIGSDTNIPLSISSKGTGTVTLTSAATTGTAINVTANSITTGSAFKIDADVLTTGNVVEIEQDNRDMLALSDRDLTVGGHSDLTSQTNITATYVYDTSNDTDGGRWTDDDRARSSSWYNETIDNTAPACVVDTDDRCGQRAFPKKAILVATTTKLYIYDAKDNTLWMDFRKGSGSTEQMIGPTTNSTGSSIFALNGKIYYGNNGSVGRLHVMDFKTDNAKRYDATDWYLLNKNIANRNSTVAAYDIHSGTTTPIINITVNDIHGQVVNGKTYIAIGTDAGMSVINETDDVVYDYDDEVTAADEDYNAVWLDKQGNLWALNETAAQLEKWASVTSDSADENPGTPDTTWDETTVPALYSAAPTIGVAPDALTVKSGTSIVDGKSPTVYVGHSAALSVISTKDGDETNGAVKYYTKDYITDQMIGDIKGMWPFNETASLTTSGTDINDRSDAANKLMTTATTTNNIASATGVRGTGLDFDGTDDYLCSDTNDDTTCDNDTDLDFTGTSMSIGAWVKYDALGAGDTILSKSNSTLGYILDFTSGGAPRFYLDTDTTTLEDTACTTAIGTGVWAYIVATYDGANKRIYHNGVLCAIEAKTGNVTASTIPFEVGARGTAASTFWDGVIDEPFATNETLSEAQIKNMYQVGLRALQSHNSSDDRDDDGTAADADTLQNIFGSSSNVSAVNVDDSNSYIYLGTRETSDGNNDGGVSVIGVNSDSRAKTYSINGAQADDDGTTFANDDIVSLSVQGKLQPDTSCTTSNCNGRQLEGYLSIGTDADFWAESHDVSFQDFIANTYNPFGTTLNQSNLLVDNIFSVVNQLSSKLNNLAIEGDYEPYIAEVFRVNPNAGSESGIVAINNFSTAIAGTTATTNNVAGLFVATQDLDTISALVRNSNTGAITMANVGTAGAQGDPGVLTIEGAGSDTTAYNLITAYNSLTRSDATAVFRVRADGNVFGEAAFNASGADYAEYFATEDIFIEPGDVVSIASPSAQIADQDQSAITKTASKYERQVLGIISTNPAFVGNNPGGKNDNKENYKLVALNGRVPTKVSTENGSIEIGDYLTSSSIPGVAMKATKPGQVVGKAMESYAGFEVSKIMVFVNVTYADPGNFFASLSLDDEGNLLIPQIKTDKLVISTAIDLRNSTLLDYQTKINSNQTTYDLDVLSSLRTLETAVLSDQANLATQSAQIATLEDKVASDSATLANQIATTSASLVAQIASAAAELAKNKSDIESLKLTPPDILIATESATLADLTVTSEASFSAKLSSYDMSVSNSFKSFGSTTLGTTTIAGDLTVDGTLSISQNSISSLGTLYLQNSPLAGNIDLFNGKISINSDGKLTAQTITATEYQAVAGTSIGTGTILLGDKSTQIASNIINEQSRIFVTPLVATNLVLAVTNVDKNNKTFTISINEKVPADIRFNWWIVNEISASGE